MKSILTCPLKNLNNVKSTPLDVQTLNPDHKMDIIYFICNGKDTCPISRTRANILIPKV